jgi:hypothetical protein
MYDAAVGDRPSVPRRHTCSPESIPNTERVPAYAAAESPEESYEKSPAETTPLY